MYNGLESKIVCTYVLKIGILGCIKVRGCLRFDLDWLSQNVFQSKDLNSKCSFTPMRLSVFGLDRCIIMYLYHVK